MRRCTLALAPMFIGVLLTGCDVDQAPCPVGTWEVDEARFVEELSTNLPAGSELGIEGSLDFKFDEDGGFEWNWNATINRRYPGEAKETQQILDTVLSGTWSGRDNDIELTFAEINGTVTSSKNSEPVETTDARDIDTGRTWLATCSGSTMTVFGNSDPLPLVRK